MEKFNTDTAYNEGDIIRHAPVRYVRRDSLFGFGFGPWVRITEPESFYKCVLTERRAG